jgi:hypothetical protein
VPAAHCVDVCALAGVVVASGIIVGVYAVQVMRWSGRACCTWCSCACTGPLRCWRPQLDARCMESRGSCSSGAYAHVSAYTRYAEQLLVQFPTVSASSKSICMKCIVAASPS